MPIQKRESWLQRLYRRATGLGSATPEPVAPHLPAITSNEITAPRATGLRSLENWRDLIHQGRRVMLSWDGGPRRGTVTARG